MKYLVREPASPAGGARPPLALLLHGVGSNEADLFGLAPYLDPRLCIVSARAPFTLGPGAYGWFNIEFTPRGMLADMAQARQSLGLLPGFVDELVETHGADASRVYLVGFSQGAMMGLALALTHPGKVAGVAALSGRFPSRVFDEGDVDRGAVEGLPVLVAHGLYDVVLPVDGARDARTRLEGLGARVTYREYPMGHEVSAESLRDLSEWLTRALDREAHA